MAVRRASPTCTRRCGSPRRSSALTVVSALLYVAVMRGDRRPAYAAAPAAIQIPRRAREPFLVLGEQHHPTQPVARGAPDVADHPAPRPAHRRHDSRRRGHRQDVRRACIRMSTSCSRGARRHGREDRRPRPRGERRLLHPGSAHPRAARTRGRLRRDRARLAVLLQPAAQRSRAVRLGVLDRDAPEQPVRPRQGAVLAAGVYRPGQVPDPAAQGRGRLHDPGRDLSLRDRREPDRAGHRSAASSMFAAATPRVRVAGARLPSRRSQAAPGRTGPRPADGQFEHPQHDDLDGLPATEQHRLHDRCAAITGRRIRRIASCNWPR